MRKNLIELLLAFVFVGGVCLIAYYVQSQRQGFQMTVNPATIGENDKIFVVEDRMHPRVGEDEDKEPVLSKKDRQKLNRWLVGNGPRPVPSMEQWFEFESMDIELRFSHKTPELVQEFREKAEKESKVLNSRSKPSASVEETEYKTSVGVFKKLVMVSGYKDRDFEGKTFTTTYLYLPGGKCISSDPTSLQIDSFFEADGKVFFISPFQIRQWVDENSAKEVVGLLGFDEDSRIQASTDHKLIAGKYIPVIGSAEPVLRGFLEYHNGNWKYHRREQAPLQFDPVKKTFKELP